MSWRRHGWQRNWRRGARSSPSPASPGRSPSTVAYRVNKHGLSSPHAARHRPRGGLTREQLEPLIEEGRSIREIATELDHSPTAVRHWLGEYELKTQPSRYVRSSEATAVVRQCARHGWTTFVRTGRDGHFRCGRCNSDAVTERRRRVKELLVAEFGGRCRLCGFDRYAGALQFHHVDPMTKGFQLGGRGLTRSLKILREEAKKCVLLCANCHAMVEAGVATLPLALPSSGHVAHG